MVRIYHANQLLISCSIRITFNIIFCSALFSLLICRGVAVDDQGYICVADSGNNRIQIFHPDGSFLRAFGSWGSGDAEFKGLEGVAIMSNGNILVCDRENHRVQVFWGGSSRFAAINWLRKSIFFSTLPTIKPAVEQKWTIFCTFLFFFNSKRAFFDNLWSVFFCSTLPVYSHTSLLQIFPD